jgi:hypothetical protein
MNDEADKVGKLIKAALLAAILALSVSAQPQTITGKVMLGEGVRTKSRAVQD